MQVSNSLSVSQLKTVSTPSVPPIDRSPLPATLNSSATSVSMPPDVVTFSTPVPAAESSDLIQPVPTSGSPNDLSPDANQITAERSEVRNVTDESGDTDEAPASNVSEREGSAVEGRQDDGSSQTVGQDSARADSESNRPDDTGLTPQQEEQVAELAARDAEVKSHERAHQAVGGQYAGSISYTFQTGPDGKRYAIGGEVPIDVAPVAGDPQATIDKMRTVKAAALAPAEPSAQDRTVASTAGRLLVEAQIELAEEKRLEQVEAREEASSNSERTNRAIQLYEGFIGLGVSEVDPKDLIDELV